MIAESPKAPYINIFSRRKNYSRKFTKVGSSCWMISLEILKEEGLSPREVFVRETEVTLEFFVINKFIMQEIKELIKTKKELAPFFIQMRTMMYDLHKNSLIRLLGEQITPHIWDMVTVYGGIIKEFNFLMIFEK